jgi:hypothetical protein
MPRTRNCGRPPARPTARTHARTHAHQAPYHNTSQNNWTESICPEWCLQEENATSAWLGRIDICEMQMWGLWTFFNPEKGQYINRWYEGGIILREQNVRKRLDQRLEKGMCDGGPEISWWDWIKKSEHDLFYQDFTRIYCFKILGISQGFLSKDYPWIRINPVKKILGISLTNGIRPLSIWVLSNITMLFYIDA